MHPSDQEWLIAQLPASERAGLAALLTELETLGIPADPELIDGVVIAKGDRMRGSNDRSRDSHASAGNEVQDAMAVQIARLERAAPARMAAILREEPPGLIVEVLRLREWPWRQRVLAELGGKQRQVKDLEARRAGSGNAGAGAGRSSTGSALGQQLVMVLSQRMEPTVDGRVSGAKIDSAQMPETVLRRPRSRTPAWIAALLRKGVRP
jgi:hypothetical protein